MNQEEQKARLRQQFIKADIVDLSNRRNRAILRAKKEQTTISNLERKICSKKALLIE